MCSQQGSFSVNGNVNCIIAPYSEMKQLQHWQQDQAQRQSQGYYSLQHLATNRLDQTVVVLVCKAS